MPNKPYWIVNLSTPEKAKVYIYGDIGYDIEPADFIAELRTLEKDYANIDVHISTNGGCIFKGFTILNAMRASKANIETYVDGLAASMGSIVMLGGRKVHISKIARVMTHNASTVAIGGASSLRATADMVEGLEDTIASIYAEKTGLTKEEAKAKYFTGNDRWITAEMALEEKLADSIYDITDAPPISIPKNATRDQVVNIFQNVFSNNIQSDTSNPNMKKITLSITPALAALLSLPQNGANADELQVESAIQTLHEKALKADGLSSQLAQAKLEKENALQAIEDQKIEAAATEVNGMLETALNKDKKITVALRNTLATQFAGKPKELKMVLDNMPGFKSVIEEENGNPGDDLPAKFQNKTFMELHKANLLPELKAKHPAHFARLEKAHKESK